MFRSDSPAERLRPSRPVRALQILLWVVAALLLGEIAVRLDTTWIARHNRLAVEEMDRRVGLAGAFAETLWEVPWRTYKPNSDFRAEYKGRECRITTNSRGFRGPEVALPKPPGVYRVVCIGGSTTIEGWTDETTYPALLQARLRENLGGAAIEVVNAGISGYPTAQELARFEDYLALQPDLILEYGCINDLSGMMPGLLRSTSGWRSFLRRSELLARFAGRRLLPSDAEVLRRFEAGSFANLREMAARAAARGAAIAYASFAVVRPERLTRTERAYVDYTVKVDWKGEAVGLSAYRRWIDLYNRELRGLCAREGCLYLPLAEEMPGEMTWFQDLCHMTDAGIARKAEILARHLEPAIRASRARVVR